MPTNKLIYFGVIIIAASVLLWLGAKLLERVDWILPYTAGVGLLLMIGGMFMEINKRKQGKVDVAEPLEAGGGPASSVIPEEQRDSTNA